MNNISERRITGEMFCNWLAEKCGLPSARLRTILIALKRFEVVPMGARGGRRNQPIFTPENCADFLIALLYPMAIDFAVKSVAERGALKFVAADGFEWNLRDRFLYWVEIFRSEGPGELPDQFPIKFEYYHGDYAICRELIFDNGDHQGASNYYEPWPGSNITDEIFWRYFMDRNGGKLLTNIIWIDRGLFMATADFLGALPPATSLNETQAGE